MNVGIVHEWLASYAGSEKVIEQMLEVYPAAEIYSLVDFLPEKDRAWLADRKIHTSFIQRLPFSRRKFRGYLPLMPLAVEQFDLAPHDVVISSNHAVAKGVITRADQLHISYVHTPIRYAWDLKDQYLREAGLTWGLRSILVRMMMHYIRRWDLAAASRVDTFVANSHYVARRIRKTYRREAEVLYPPVDIDAYPFCEQKEDYYVTASRLVPYKKVDLIVEAFTKNGLPLMVIGDGPDMKKIAKLAGKNVKLLGYQSQTELTNLMQRAKAFVFAADEDFGITPVEAQACGTPVIAYGRGGVTETVLEGETGIFFDQQTVESLNEAVTRFEASELSYEPELIRKHAEQFGIERFRRELQELVDREWQKFQAPARGRQRERRLVQYSA
jgi:glycosyltransferase involved in cell wall biosynthesis